MKNILKTASTLASVAVIAIATFGVGYATLISQDAEARSFGGGGRSFGGGGGFSRSTFRSSSSSSRGLFSSSKPSSRPSNPAANTTNTKKPTFTSERLERKNIGSGGFGTAATGASRQQAKAALSQYRNKFKVQPTAPADLNKYRSTYSRNPVYQSAGRSDPNTYYDRRSTYYRDMTQPAYIFNSSPSFGIWDTLFLYTLLSNNANAANFAHNHANDEDYKKWRADADRLAVDNQELRNQLAEMDKSKAALSGQPVNPAYLPTGVDPDIAMAEEARRAAMPTFRFCAGSDSGTYHHVATKLLAPALTTVNLVVVNTTGTPEILNRVASGDCDGGFVQNDGFWNYVEDHQTTNLDFTQIFSPYKEQVNLVCNSASNVEELGDITSGEVVVFAAKNSGGFTTWRNLVGEDKDYADVPSSVTKPEFAVDSNEAAITKVLASNNSCMIYVAGPYSAFMNKVNNISAGGKLRLVKFTDESLREQSTTPSGDTIYTSGSIDRYNNLLEHTVWLWFFGGEVDTLNVDTDFIVGNKWKAANPAVYDKFVIDIVSLKSDIETMATK